MGSIVKGFTVSHHQFREISDRYCSRFFNSILFFLRHSSFKWCLTFGCITSHEDGRVIEQSFCKPRQLEALIVLMWHVDCAVVAFLCWTCAYKFLYYSESISLNSILYHSIGVEHSSFSTPSYGWISQLSNISGFCTCALLHQYQRWPHVAATRSSPWDLDSCAERNRMWHYWRSPKFSCMRTVPWNGGSIDWVLQWFCICIISFNVISLFVSVIFLGSIRDALFGGWNQDCQLSGPVKASLVMSKCHFQYEITSK